MTDVLAGVALLFAVMRLTWEARRGVVMAVDPALTLFGYRQSVLLAAAATVFAARLAQLLHTAWLRPWGVAVCERREVRPGRLAVLPTGRPARSRERDGRPTP